MARLTIAQLLAISIASLTAFQPHRLASAHHGHSGQFDNTRILYIEGTVEQATIAMPHPQLVIRVGQSVSVPGQLPEIETLGIADAKARVEAVTPGVHRLHFASGTFFVPILEQNVQVGDRIAVLALRDCEPPHQVRSSWLRVASGEVFTHGRRQTEVAGCQT